MTLDFARKGPLWQSVRSDIPAEEWVLHGDEIVSQLTGKSAPVGAMPHELDEALAIRVYHLYLPLYFFCRERARLGCGSSSAPIIGLSAPQGCGKTTLVDVLTERFAADGMMCAAVSFDDFYLRGVEQDAVAAAHPENALLQVRGNAGTHDVELGVETLSALSMRSSAPARIPIPRYDKAARGGRGDRAPEATWPVLSARPDVVLLEGWMAAFCPLPEGHSLLDMHAGLPEINLNLNSYNVWHSLVDSWVVIAIDDPSCVFDWRLQAEHAMRASGRDGMSDEQVRDFVSRYLPAYNAFLPGLYKAASTTGVGGKPTLMTRVDSQRRPVHD